MSTQSTIETPAELPGEGFVRLSQVLKVIPVSRSSWYNGVRAGKYPRPNALDVKTKVYRVEDIRALIDRINGQAQCEATA